ncbi:MAG: AAA family ATPase [Treponemataceae bacterium]
MKKKNIINLIKYYTDNNDVAFREEAAEIARDFYCSGDTELGEYITSLISSVNTFVPQMSKSNITFAHKVPYSQSPLPLPEPVKNDIFGIVNAIENDAGVNKFLFYGAPGTGKTETVKQIAHILSRELYSVDFDTLIDSQLGQTSKNIANLFLQINDLAHPETMIILFDEIDSIALDRTNSNDLREMGRATSAMLKGLDNLNEKIVLIATTNLYNLFDKALIRRFDFCIDFSRYTKDDLREVGQIILSFFLAKFKYAKKNIRLCNKILNLFPTLPYPGELKNLIKTTIAFSKPNDEYDYLRRLYVHATNSGIPDIKDLQEQGFTVREIEILTRVSKSQVARNLQED